MQRGKAEWVWRGDLCGPLSNEGKCYGLNVRLVEDEKTRTVRCPRCGCVRTFDEDEWKERQALKHVLYRYMPGKYFFRDLPAEGVFRMYMREVSHEDWVWLVGHDYELAKIRGDEATQRRIRDAVKLLVEKMDYNPEFWFDFLAMFDEMSLQKMLHVPLTIVTMAKKKFMEIYGSEERALSRLHLPLGGYTDTLHDIYYYHRWRGDRAACWVTREVMRIIHAEHHGKKDSEYHTGRLDLEIDPFLDGFEEDVINGKERKFDLREITVQWHLREAEAWLTGYRKEGTDVYWGKNARGVIDYGFRALAARLGYNTLYPVDRRFSALDSESPDVARVVEDIGDRELLELYRAVEEYCPNYDWQEPLSLAEKFLKKVKKILVNLQPKEGEEKVAYIS